MRKLLAITSIVIIVLLSVAFTNENLRNIYSRPSSTWPKAFVEDGVVYETAQETARESAARLDGGRYYPATVIASLYDRIHELEGRPSGPAWLPPDTFTARREAVRRVAARIPGATTALRSIRQRIRPGNDSR